MNEIATIPQPAIQPVSEKQAQAWVSLAKAKNELIFSLQKRELAAQNILIPVQDSDDYKIIDAALAEYRKAYSEMSDERKQFTGMIDKNVVRPLMEYEKRVDPSNNEAYGTSLNKSLTLRKEEKERTDLINAKNEEKARFKIHVENEFLRVSAIYSDTLHKVISQAYTQWLRAGLKEPDLNALKRALKEVKVGQIQKFTPHYLTREDMLTIYETCQKADYESILTSMDFVVEQTFANWDSDIANAEAAIQAQQEATKLAEIEAKKKADEEAAMNMLIITAGTMKVEEPKIKRTVVIEVVESEGWAKSVIAAFITNLPHLAKYIRVKSWSKLNIGQMATYLGQYATETGDTLKGLELKTIEK